MSNPAFEEQFNRHHDKLYTYALFLTHNEEDARDLIQESALKAIRGYHAFRENSNFTAWFKKIQENTFLDLCRQKKKHRTILTGDHSDLIGLSSSFHAQSSDFNADISLYIEDSDIIAFLEQTPLPQNQKQVAISRFMDISFKEIADESNVSVNTALGIRRYIARNLIKTFGSVENLLEELHAFKITRMVSSEVSESAAVESGLPHPEPL